MASRPVPERAQRGLPAHGGRRAELLAAAAAQRALVRRRREAEDHDIVLEPGLRVRLSGGCRAVARAPRAASRIFQWRWLLAMAREAALAC
jgi:hypothetical protein